jgi:hypothetical protein
VSIAQNVPRGTSRGNQYAGTCVIDPGSLFNQDREFRSN